MLYIVYKHAEKHGETEVQWHVGKKLSRSHQDRLREQGWEVSEVQADGPELEYIEHNFGGIPFAYERTAIPRTKLVVVQRWHGDFAKFIAHNLPAVFDK